MIILKYVYSSWHAKGNARIAGLQKGLHLTDYQYQVAVTVTFVYDIHLKERTANTI
jgi:hypothetical protein